MVDGRNFQLKLQAQDVMETSPWGGGMKPSWPYGVTRDAGVASGHARVGPDQVNRPYRRPGC